MEADALLFHLQGTPMNYGTPTQDNTAEGTPDGSVQDKTAWIAPLLRNREAIAEQLCQNAQRTIPLAPASVHNQYSIPCNCTPHFGPQNASRTQLTGMPLPLRHYSSSEKQASQMHSTEAHRQGIVVFTHPGKSQYGCI